MRDFYLINTFFNIVYQNDLAVLRDFKSSYEYIRSFVEWLENRHIEMPLLTNLSHDDWRMMSTCKTIKDIDHILHIALSDELLDIARQYSQKTHILYIPGIHNKDVLDIAMQKYQDVYFYAITEPFAKEDLSFFDPFLSFFCAMNHADLWPGVLIFNQSNSVFQPMSSQTDFERLLNHIDNNDNLFDTYHHDQEDSYFLQISDLHLGKNKGQKGLMQLYTSLDNITSQLYSRYPLKVLITGDLMESPNRRNMYMANDFMNSLKKRYKADVTFILGNHDVIVHGFNMARNQKSKVIAYLLGENIKVLEKEKIIIIKMDTTSEGNLARGKVGERQLKEIDDELEAIDHLEDYTLIVMLHHHVYPISKAQFIKTKWHEKTFINRIIETSKVLVDAPLLIEWLDKKDKICFSWAQTFTFFSKERCTLLYSWWFCNRWIERKQKPLYLL